VLTLDEFFTGWEDSRMLFDALHATMEAIGAAELRIGKSQVSFRRRRAFAWAWIPDRYLHGKHAPLVLTVSLNRRDTSARWKETVGPMSGRFNHHLELRALADIDAEVEGWLREAWETAE
jgi:hypothetical protein